MQVTIVFTSHLLDEVEHICTRIAILHKRVILAQGTVNELKDKYSKSQEIHLETVSGKYKQIMGVLRKLPEVAGMQLTGHKLLIFTAKPNHTLQRILQQLDESREVLMDVDVRKPTLNEVFEYFTK